MREHTEYTVKHLLDMLEGVPHDALVMISYEGCVGRACKEESPGYDEEDNTFEVGTE